MAEVVVAAVLLIGSWGVGLGVGRWLRSLGAR